MDFTIHGDIAAGAFVIIGLGTLVVHLAPAGASGPDLDLLTLGDRRIGFNCYTVCNE